LSPGRRRRTADGPGDRSAGYPPSALFRGVLGRLVTEVVSRRGDPDPSAALETVTRTGEPVTALVLERLAA
jgi:hypothetical protein